MSIQNRKFALVGGEAEIVLYEIENQLAQPIFDELYLEALRLQKIFNFYDKESELSRLNQERKIKASKELKEVIKFAISFSKLTKGEYDIRKGKQILLQKNGKDILYAKNSFKEIKIKGDTIELSDKDSIIDLGSVAKGYIGDKLVNFLICQGVKSGFIDLRGDMLCFGSHTEEIVIQHPRQKEGTIGRFHLKDAAVATSGDYKQFIKDYDHSHIVGKKDLVSVTVVAKSLMEADILGTVFFVMGKKGSIDYLIKHKNIKAFLIDKDMNEYNLNSLIEKK